MTSDGDLSMIFFGYPYALRFCLNFTRNFSSVAFETFALSSVIALLLMKAVTLFLGQFGEVCISY